VHHYDVAQLDAALVVENDGATIRYGPDFEQLPLAIQTGLVAHEVLHVALRHAPRYLELRRQIGDVDLELFNICADAIVNSTLSHLSWLELDSPVLLEDLLATALKIRQDLARSLLEWDLERLYRAVDDRLPPSPRKAEQGRGRADQDAAAVGEPSKTGAQGQQSQAGEARQDGPRAAQVRALGRHSPRDLVPDAGAEYPERAAEQAREWRERILRGHAADGVHSMLRELLADLPKVRTPWEQVLRTQLARGLSNKPALSWSRPSRSYLANHGRMGPRRAESAGEGRRMPWEPGRSSSSAVARLAVLVDVSGSIDASLLARFAREIEAITRRMEAKTLMVVGDDRVRRVECFEPGRSNLRGIQFQGGGGTDFSPLLEEAERWRPDLGVFLTDLDGPADYRPAFPVLWAVPSACAAMPHPFGRKLVLD
jgi:predicted metal-dependent peptidase